MGTGAKEWNEAKTMAKKILGDKAKIPEPKANFDKMSAEWSKADNAYKAAVDALQRKILELQNSTSSAKNALKQHAERIAKTDFGLDRQNPDEKKKIEEGRKVLAGFLQYGIEACDTNSKNLEALDKHSMAIARYECKEKI
jgi:hypothetical protein